MTVAVVTDSSSCLPERLAGAANVTVIELPVLVDAQQAPAGVKLASKLAARDAVTTSRPSPEQFARCYRRLLDQGASAVVSAHLSAELSGTVAAARTAAAEFDGAVVVVDSRTVAMALGFAVLDGAAVAQAGGDASATAAAIRHTVSRSHTRFYVDQVDFLRRGGRLTSALARARDVIPVRTLLQVNAGLLGVTDRVRTVGRVHERLVELAIADAAGTPCRVAVHHLDTAQRAHELAAELANNLTLVSDIVVSGVDAVLAAHCGPGMVGMALVRS